MVDFFGVALAEKIEAEKGKADLILGNNVLAHVPDLNDFVGGAKLLMKPTTASSPSNSRTCRT